MVSLLAAPAMDLVAAVMPALVEPFLAPFASPFLASPCHWVSEGGFLMVRISVGPKRYAGSNDDRLSLLEEEMNSDKSQRRFAFVGY